MGQQKTARNNGSRVLDMANPVKFDGFNIELKAPQGMDNLSCSSLPIYRNGINCVSCWELTEEELQEVLKTKRIFISLWSGKTQPPIYVGNEENVRQLIADNGVWSK